MLNVHSTSFVFQDLEQSEIKQFPLKTPARSIKGQRIVHNENSVYGYPRLGLTGKKNNATLSTPIPKQFQSHMASKHTARSGNPSILSEITNRTPFNKGNSTSVILPTFSKSSKSFYESTACTALYAHRISSTRKLAKLPRSINKKLETPNTTGDHWNVDDMAIDVSIPHDGNVTEESYELEYLPPTAIDPLYEPEFEMPDFTEVGKTIVHLFRHFPVLSQDNETAKACTAACLHDPAPLYQLDIPDLIQESFVSHSHLSELDLLLISKPPTMGLSRIPKPPRGWMRKTVDVDKGHLSRIPVLSHTYISKCRAARPISHNRVASLYSSPGIDIPSKLHSRTKSLPSNSTRKVRHETAPLTSDTPLHSSSKSPTVENNLLGLFSGFPDNIDDNDFLFTVE